MSAPTAPGGEGMGGTLQPGFLLLHGNRAEALRDVLVAWTQRYPLQPLENEVVLVQSNGIAQWLQLALAQDQEQGGCGICAGLSFSLPSRFLWQIYRAVLGPGAVPLESPFEPARLQWRLLRLLPQLLERDPELYRPLCRFLQEDHDARRRYQLSRHLADLYDQYQVYRADWLTDWVEGRAVISAGAGRSPLLPLPEEQRWQAALWQELCKELDVAPGLLARGGRAAVHQAFQARLQQFREAGTRPPGLPRRILVFGISTLPQQFLEVLGDLAHWSQVMMGVHNPCRHYWADIIGESEVLRARSTRQQRRPGSPALLEDDTLRNYAHPLLAAWGKQGRDSLALLDHYDESGVRAAFGSQLRAIGKRIDLFESPLSVLSPAPGAAHPGPLLVGGARPGYSAAPPLLLQIQDDILELRSLPEIQAQRRCLVPAQDRSLSFHVSHSAQREVEILHDQLLANFAADPNLSPRQVIVMVPDLAAYAPHVHAVFGRIGRDDPRYIPFSLVDHSRSWSNSLLAALATLLELPHSRLGSGQVFDLLAVPALQARFGLGEDDLSRIQRWRHAANVRWGLHAEHRATLLATHPAGEAVAARDLDLGTAAASHTWLFGMRRWLLGYAVGAEGETWQGIEPCAALGGGEAARLGPLLEFLGRLEITWRDFSQSAPPWVWQQRLHSLLEDFFVPQTEGERTTLAQLEQELDQWVQACAEAGLEEDLPLSVVSQHWLAALEEGGGGANFFAGAVIFATLMPMRAIPFRQVCLLGMNDGDYPRSRQPLDFDLLRGNYRPGDRSRREDDRYLFLEALLSARERLYLSWVGRSVLDNSERPPSVLVAQLRDHIRAGWSVSQDCGAKEERNLSGNGGSNSGGGGQRLLELLTTIHPLQPFSRAYFKGDERLFTYAREWQPQRNATAGGRRAGKARHQAGQADGTTAKTGRGELVDDASAIMVPVSDGLYDRSLTLTALADFLKNPVRGFFQQRLQVSFGSLEEDEEVEPFELGPLTSWDLRNQLIEAGRTALHSGQDPANARQETLARITRRAELPAGAFGKLSAAQIESPLGDLFVAYQGILATWPHELIRAREWRFIWRTAHSACLPHSPGTVPAPLELHATFGRIRARSNPEDHESGLVPPTAPSTEAHTVPHTVPHTKSHYPSRYGFVVLEPGSLRSGSSGKSYRYDRIFRYWVWHLGLQLGYASDLTTTILAHDGGVELLPLPAAVAEGHLSAMLATWQDGMTRALPFAIKTALAWLGASTSEQRRAAASREFEGDGWHYPGEMNTDPYLRRAWPDFAALSASDEFGELAKRLLCPLIAAVHELRVSATG